MSDVHHSHPYHEHHEHSHKHSHEDTDHPQPMKEGHEGKEFSSRRISMEQDLLAKNDAYAQNNRSLFQQRGIFVINLVSSPGSGKTSLLVHTIQRQKTLYPDLSCAVIEGDQQTDNDAKRIRAEGIPALQINTGKGCHLDAHMVAHAFSDLSPKSNSVLYIENVGNLVCPSSFDLGEAHKVVIFSVTEGEDKPLKYPDMFRAADVLLLNKCDLLPHLDFSVDLALINARKINPKIQVFKMSATTGEGLDDWVRWVYQGLQAIRLT